MGVEEDAADAAIQRALAAEAAANASKDAPAGPVEPAKPTVLDVVGEAYFALFDSLFRIYDYARATKAAFAHLTSWKGPSDPIGADDFGKLIAAVNLKGEADFLRHESERADAMVYGQATISLWSALSCGTEDMIVALLANDEKLLALDVANKIEVPLGEFHAMTPQQRIHRIAKSIISETDGQRWGDQYSNALKALGFPKLDAIEERIKRALIEFWAVRNCLVHNRGVVDDSFKRQCGFSELTVGATISVTGVKLYEYMLVATYWASKLCERIEARYRPEAPEWRATRLADRLAESLKKLDEDTDVDTEDVTRPAAEM